MDSKPFNLIHLYFPARDAEWSDTSQEPTIDAPSRGEIQHFDSVKHFNSVKHSEIFWFHKKLSDSVKHFDFVKHSENIFYSVKKLSDLWNILISWSILKIFWFCKKNFLICETFWFRETFWKHFDTVRKLWFREIIWFCETILLLMLLPIWNWYDQWSRLVAFLDLVILLKLELLTIPIK